MEEISTTKAPSAIGPYSQAIEVNGIIYTSGQIPLTPEGELIEADIQKQTHQVIQNAGAVLQAAGSDLSLAVKVTLFIKDMEQFQEINEVYSQYFRDHKPARSCVEVARLPKDVLIEMEVVAKK